MRVFFDTNVLVSAFLARGLCADLLRLVLSEHTLVCSELVVAELRAVLSRKARLPLQQIDAIEAFLRDQPVAPRPATISSAVGQSQGLLGAAAGRWLIDRASRLCRCPGDGPFHTRLLRFHLQPEANGFPDVLQSFLVMM